MSDSWFVYILRCDDGSLYTGITTDIDRRIKEHKRGDGSSYTASRGIKEVVYKESAKNRSDASQREAEIKQLSHDEKVCLIK